MTRPPDPRWTRLRLEAEPSAEPRYHLTAFAARAGLRVQTIRRYEAHGLIEPIAADPDPPRYSEADVERARRVRRLVDDLGVNLAGAAAILHLRDQLVALQRELLALHADQQSHPPR